MNRDRIAACTYGRSRSSGNVPPRPPRPSPTDGTLPALSDSSEPSSSYSLSPDLRERSSMLSKQLEWKPSPRGPDKVVPAPSSGASVAKKAPGAAEHPPRSTLSSFTIIPSIHFQTIPRPLHLPLSAISPEHVQVSCVSGDDLGMTL